MTSNELESALLSLIRRYGFELVNRCLRDIGLSEDQPGCSSLRGILSDTSVSAKPPTRRPKISAPQYVAKLDLPLEKKPAIVELAKRFERKAFLPTFGDIDNFCQTHGLSTPASRTRASAIPRLFRYISTLDSSRTQAILDEEMYSGPSKLEPIAEAIRKNGRASR